MKIAYLLTLVATLFVAGCDKPADPAPAKPGDKIKEGADKVKEGADKAKDAVKDATK